MFKRIAAGLLCLAILIALPVIARADTGPKPSVQITFTGAPDGIYYGTLLSRKDSTGPAFVWDGDPGNAFYKPEEGDYDIWEKFVQYQDADGFYFLQQFWKCSENNQLNWVYYPPSEFKILLYFPESDQFYVSGIYQRYAFDSYFTADLSMLDSTLIQAHKSYDHTWEMVSLAARIALTILLELGIALSFGCREKKALTFLAVVNIVTQIALNVALNILNYNNGPEVFVRRYVAFELAVFAAEAVLYVWLLPKFSSKLQSKGKSIGYAAVANGVSFILGMWLAYLIPGIF